MSDLWVLTDAGKEWEIERRATPADILAAYRDLLANGQRVEWCEEHGEHAHGKRFCAVGIDPESRTCRIVSKLLIDPPTEEVTGE